ncbi:MAG: hemolysin III family protein [Deltaproteobacteria bacterium]|nr:hemolysin III family protein [Deltaproteobacteria bacterium]
MDLPAEKRTKPKLRGHSHQAAFFAALGAGIVLVAAAPTPRTTLAAAVYATTLVLLFGISALYHRPWWPDRPREVFARLDHAMIFIFIAGSYTPFGMLGLSAETGNNVLISMWVAAAVLALSKIVGLRMPRWMMSSSYVAMGWFAAWSMPEASRIIGPFGTVLLVVGGVLYTIGAVIFWRKAPNPVPGVFGYHEVFHMLVVAAGIAHFIAVARLVFAG